MNGFILYAAAAIIIVLLYSACREIEKLQGIAQRSSCELTAKLDGLRTEIEAFVCELRSNGRTK